MRRHGLVAFSFVLALAWGGNPSRAWAQTPPAAPDDDTATSARVLDEDAEAKAAEAKGGDAERDDPTSRLKWQRKAWGVVTPTFRQNAIKEGKYHSDKKNARGRSGSRGPRAPSTSRTAAHGARARQRPRPHGPAAPHEPRPRLPPHLGRRPVAHRQLERGQAPVDGADRRPPPRAAARWPSAATRTRSISASAIPTTRSWSAAPW